MEVQWQQKWMKFSHEEKRVTLQGLSTQPTQLLHMSGDQYYSMQNQDDI